MIILKVHVTAPVKAPQLLRRNVLLHVLVKLELLAGYGVDEGGDDLEETPDNPWY